MCRHHLRTFDSFAEFWWESPTPITRIVALDQTNGTGGFVDVAMGLNELHAYIEFVNVGTEIIDFIIHVYNEWQSSNDLIIGEQTDNNVLLLT